MLASATRSQGSMWGPSRNKAELAPLRPPSEAAKGKKPVALPSSSFTADYNCSAAELGAYKIENDQGRLRVVSNFKQGFSGQGVERYPDGQTYVGDYIEAKRNGTGTFIESNGDAMVSRFFEGKPVGEGAIFNPSLGLSTVTRTHQGKRDDTVSVKEGAAIAKHIGVAIPTGFVVAKTPPAATKKREPVSYDTEATRSYQSQDVHTLPPRDAFLQKLEAAEERDTAVTNTWAARSSLIPRVA